MKRSFRLLLATVAVLAVMCSGAWAADITISKDNEPLTWEGGNTYYVSGTRTFTDRITVSGDVKLILSDGSVLSADKGINVSGDTAGTKIHSLTIDGTGALKAASNTSAAAIGAGFNENGGKITIKGGNVTATSYGASGSDGAAIGGGSNSGEADRDAVTGGTITIEGGTVTATSYGNGAAIGGGNNGKGGTITISGGTVTAVAGSRGAAIGGGRRGSRGEITIESGTVIASASSGAGIGGGGAQNAEKGGSDGTITIKGGTVTASSNTGAGIGGGENGDGGEITILGGIVISESTGAGAGIGSGFAAGVDTNGGTIKINGGIVIASGSKGNGIGSGGRSPQRQVTLAKLLSDADGNAWIDASGVGAYYSGGGGDFKSGVLFIKSTGTVYGTPSISGDVTIPEGKVLNISGDVTLTVATNGKLTIVDGATLNVVGNGVLKNGGGAIVNNGMVYLPDDADPATIPTLKMTGSGYVVIGEKTYTNDGTDTDPPAQTYQLTMDQRNAVKSVLAEFAITDDADAFKQDSIDTKITVSEPDLDVEAQMTISQDVTEGGYIELNGDRFNAKGSEAIRFYKVFRDIAGTAATKVHEFGAEYVSDVEVDGEDRVEFDALVVIIDGPAPETLPVDFVQGAIESQGLVERTNNGYKVVVVWDGELDGVAYDPIVAATAAPIEETSRSSDGTCASGVLAPLAIAALAMIKRRSR